VQLSDPADYDGGELEFMMHRSVVQAERAQGTVVLFPSFLQHRVRPVTRGVRRSLVFWVHGPPFR
jgi:PKHD-type hydroxylase